MKLTEKAKKRLTLAGLGVVCVVLVIAIASRFTAEAPKEADVQPLTTATNTVNPSVSTPAAAETPTSTPEISVTTPTGSASQVTDTGDSTGTDQSIQAEVTKPAEPSGEAKTNPSQKPDGQKVTNSDSGTSSSSTPKSGDKKDGKIYVPGFGWIDDNGGGVDQGTVGGEGDINKQVGSMN